MKKFYLFVLFVFSFSLAFAQPANNTCGTAQAIGSLPTPSGCPSGSGANVVIPGTLVGATAANPYTYQGTGCTGSSTTMASPAIDVWYTFVATGYQLNLTLSGTVANPNVAVYSGTCASLGGGVGGCAVGTAGGSASLTVQQMVIGQTYYLQVSGNSPTATGTFTLTMNNSIDCNNCLGASNLTVTPPPTNGAYAPGTTVNFCFKVNSYTQVNTNWLHGVQLAFGSGWNLASITTTPPPACQGTGYWQYYPTGITDNSGQTWPAGFYFETVTGQNNPGNNFGDNCSGTISAANWNFCFSITTAVACTPGSNLSVVINTSGDGESGSWSSLGCSGDPATTFNAIGSCCPPTMSSTPVSCNGGTDGTATATPVGTQNPYNYTWTNSSGTVVSTTTGAPGANTASGLPAGTYTVTVVDKNNCSVTNTVTITQPTALTLTATPTNATCGSNNGSISLAAGGGTPGYNYSINGGALTGTTNYTGLAGGTYTMEVKDSKGCIKTVTTTIITTGTVTPTVNSATVCNGNSATLTAGGATTFSWAPATGLSATTGSTVTASPTSTTTYTITGTSGGCTGTVTSVVTVNPLPTINVTNGTICTGGTTSLTASGASTYTWSPATGLSSTTGATVNANPASTTTYTVTGTNANGCVNTGTTSVTVVTNPTVNVNPATICLGQQTATLTATGASTYAWSPSTGLSATTGSVVTANPAATTTYTIIGTAGTCTASATSVVTVNPLPTITVNSGTICLGQQTANLNAGGAVTYTWIPSTGLSSTNTAATVASPSVTTTYTVAGVDANGCANFTTTAVVVNPLPTVTVNSGFICNGASTTLTANGASTYTWTPGTGLSSTNGSTVTANPASTTSYTVTGTDVNGCFDSDTTTVTVVANPTVTVTTSTICIGQQTATLTANGASTYVWTPSTGLSSTTGSVVTSNVSSTTAYTITGTAGTCTAVGTTTVTVNPLPTITVNSGTICIGQQAANLNAGGAVTYSWVPSTGLNATNTASVIATPTTTTSYTVVGIDANGCVNFNTTSVVVNPLPVITLNSTFICSGHSTTLSPTGALTYTWSPSTGLSSSNGSPVTANPATTTSYTVLGTDANGCINGDSNTVTVLSNPVIGVTTGTICVGQQTTTLTANGATTYVWSPATGLSTTTGSVVVASPASTTVYTITGTVGTCTANGTTTVTVNALPVLSIGSNSPVCVNQTLNLNAGGGLSYSWNGPNTFASTVPTPSITGVTTAASGIYTVTVTDVNTCVNTATVNVVINPLPVVSVTGSTVCLNSTIMLASGGGVGYSWSGPLAYSSNSQNPSIPNATTAMAGSYIVTVTDGNGCVNANIAQVVINPLPVVAASSDTICAGQQIATLNATGANTYSWAPLTNLNTSTGATVMANPGTTSSYTVTGTDLNNCSNTAVSIVTVYPSPPVVISPPTTSGCAPVCINFTNTASGTGTCAWNFGNGTTSTLCAPNNCFKAQGTYTVSLTLTDNNGCVNSSTALVTVYPVPTADFYATPQPTTILDNTIHFYDQSTGAVINSWAWNLGNGTVSVIQNPSCLYGDTGTYAVQLLVISNRGCKDSITKYIHIDDEFSLYVPNAFSPNGDGLNEVFFAKGEGVRDFKMYIFDRWGNQVFFSDNIYKGWDGRFQAKGETIVQEDVYVWKIECKTARGEKKHLQGHVSLIK